MHDNSKADLGDLTAELEGISNSLHVLSAATAPGTEMDAYPTREIFSMSIFALALHLERITRDLYDVNLQLQHDETLRKGA